MVVSWLAPAGFSLAQKDQHIVLQVTGSDDKAQTDQRKSMDYQEPEKRKGDVVKRWLEPASRVLQPATESLLPLWRLITGYGYLPALSQGEFLKQATTDKTLIVITEEQLAIMNNLNNKAVVQRREHFCQSILAGKNSFVSNQALKHATYQPGLIVLDSLNGSVPVTSMTEPLPIA